MNLCSIVSIKYKRSKIKIHFFPRVEIPSPTPRIINAGAKWSIFSFSYANNIYIWVEKCDIFKILSL